MRKTTFGAVMVVIASILSATYAFASGFERVTLEPISHRPASLTVIGTDGASNAYSPAELETMPTYRLKTKTPWRDEPAIFEGVRLSDILSASQLDGVEAIIVTAENDYETTIQREVWTSADILVATRVNGKAHTRRARGPIQFVLDFGAYQASDFLEEGHMVWMAVEIRPVQ